MWKKWILLSVVYFFRCDSLPFKDIPRCDSGSLPATYSLSGIPSLADISFEMPRNSLHMLHSFSLTSMMFQGEKSVHALPKTEYSKKLHQSVKIKMSHLSQPPLFHQTDKTCRHKEGRKKKGKFHQQLHCMLNKERLEDSASKESLAQFLESLQWDYINISRLNNFFGIINYRKKILQIIYLVHYYLQLLIFFKVML